MLFLGEGGWLCGGCFGEEEREGERWLGPRKKQWLGRYFGVFDLCIPARSIGGETKFPGSKMTVYASQIWLLEVELVRWIIMGFWFSIGRRSEMREACDTDLHRYENQIHREYSIHRGYFTR